MSIGLESLVLVSLHLSFAASPLSAEEATMARAETGSIMQEWAALASPYYATRRASGRRLLHLEQGEALKVVRVLSGSTSPTLRRAAADWLLMRLERGMGGDVEREILSRAVITESRPAVQQRLLHAAARDGDTFVRLRDARLEGSLSPRAFDRLLESRLLVLLESIMHEGRVPGFFDGQFNALYELDATSFSRLLRAAWDPRVNYVVRVLSIMALHERPGSHLLEQLRPLLVEAMVEIEWPGEILARDNLSMQEMQTFMLCKMSQYVRFSLAKAGIPGPIDEKIALLRSRAATALRRAETIRVRLSNSLADGDGQLHLLNRAMDYFFELGYHFQQLDRYAQAELHYVTIIDRPEHLRVMRWAHYNLACIRSIQGRFDEALDHLEGAMRSGFTDVDWARKDGDLAPLREYPRFFQILSEINLLDDEADEKEATPPPGQPDGEEGVEDEGVRDRGDG